jgi:hypothetical protein
VVYVEEELTFLGIENCISVFLEPLDVEVCLLELVMFDE